MTEDPFVAHRSLLFTVAYEMLGSAADAEDVLQESWLRWADVDHSQVSDPRAYLVRVVTRQALNRLRTLSRSREEYVGEWLPEPLLTSPDVAEDVELAESVSIAMLTVLETLGPTERAVFVLREVFEMPYGEIAEAIGKSAATVRQIARPDRDRRRACRDEPRGGERADHPDLRDAQPAEADAADSTGRTRQVTPPVVLRVAGRYRCHRRRPERRGRGGGLAAHPPAAAVEPAATSSARLKKTGADGVLSLGCHDDYTLNRWHRDRLRELRGWPAAHPGRRCAVIRKMGPSHALAEVLREHFTVIRYDRRGRGESAGKTPYSVEREIEHLAALIKAAGGSAYVCGFSSGAVLALDAAARGLPISALCSTNRRSSSTTAGRRRRPTTGRS